MKQGQNELANTVGELATRMDRMEEHDRPFSPLSNSTPLNPFSNVTPHRPLSSSHQQLNANANMSSSHHPLNNVSTTNQLVPTRKLDFLA